MTNTCDISVECIACSDADGGEVEGQIDTCYDQKGGALYSMSGMQRLQCTTNITWECLQNFMGENIEPGTI